MTQCQTNKAMKNLKKKQSFAIMDRGIPESRIDINVYMVECSSSQFETLPDGQRVYNTNIVIHEYRPHISEHRWFVYEFPYDNYWEWVNRTSVEYRNRYVVTPLTD